MKKTKLIIVGGFLGAGKTTLLWHLAKDLVNQGLRVGLVTNDQAPELVDSRLLEQSGLNVAEVAGSCFCCNFDGFVNAIHRLQSNINADIILAEPVGSCTDLTATIVRPMKRYHNTEVSLSPLTVLSDPVRLQSIVCGGNGGLHDDAAYIYSKQLEESDMMVISKIDTLTKDEQQKLIKDAQIRFPNTRVMTLSAKTGEGVKEWFDNVSSRHAEGKKLVDIDYDRYAHGEAVLGWLNGTVIVNGRDIDGDQMLKDIMHGMAEVVTKDKLPVGHIKVIAENGKEYAVGNITGDATTLQMRGKAGVADQLRLILNARVETTPERLDETVRQILIRAIGARYDHEVLAWRYLQPGRPNPTHRIIEN